MKFSSAIVLALLVSKAAFAATAEEAIERLWSLPDPGADGLREQLPNKKSPLGDWIKFHQTEPFKFRVANNATPMDGYNFVITMISCSAELLQPTGFPAGSDARTVGFTPPVYYGQVATWTQEKKGCTNAFACSYEVAIEGLNDPSAKRTFGPVGIVGSKVAPDYDCFLEATDGISF